MANESIEVAVLEHIAIDLRLTRSSLSNKVPLFAKF